MNKIKPHPESGKHSWRHLKNVEYSSHRFHRDGSQSMTINYRGIYECDCGAKKLGVAK